mmetsp:Transcript_40052/g.92798  ORF Transcript_40052/g.92798 Transcript_40052/m.92798 type:complete len:330 (+) Transcript_40052:88-1077(+)
MADVVVSFAHSERSLHSSTRSRRWARTLAAAALLLTSAYVGYALLLPASVEAGLQAEVGLQADEGESARKDGPPAVKKGGCALGTFIPMTACRKDSKGDGCCAAVRTVLHEQCACNPIPSIVTKSGGTPLSLVSNFLGCNLTDGFTDPIDYIAQMSPCLDQAEWCADRRHMRDIRLDSYPTGRVQMWDEGVASWRYVTPAHFDSRGGLRSGGGESTAQFVCNALGYAGVSKSKRVFVGASAPSGSGRSVGFALSCSEEAAQSRDVRNCSVIELDARECPLPASLGDPIPRCHNSGGPGSLKPMWVACHAYPGIPDLCARPSQVHCLCVV